MTGKRRKERQKEKKLVEGEKVEKGKKKGYSKKKRLIEKNNFHRGIGRKDEIPKYLLLGSSFLAYSTLLFLLHPYSHHQLSLPLSLYKQ